MINPYILIISHLLDCSLFTHKLATKIQSEFHTLIKINIQKIKWIPKYEF